jgi:hypothetical protein
MDCSQRTALLDQAKRELLSLNRPSYRLADDVLTEVYVALQVSTIIAQVHPRDYKKRIRRPLQEFFQDMRLPRMQMTDNQGSRQSVLVARLINEHLFQLDDFWLDEECMDFGNDHTVQISPMGYKVSFDEFEELLADTDNLTRAGSFILFLGILWGNVDKDEQENIWRDCNEIYQWDIPELPQVPGNHYIDISRLKKNLKKDGLEALSLMLEAIDGSTGNVFYDFDYETWMPLTIGEKDLLALHEDWQKVNAAKKVLDQADDLLNNRPDVFKLFLGAYLKSLRSRKD